MKEFRKIKSLKFLYEINNKGVIRNVKSKHTLKTELDKYGYEKITVWIQNERVTKTIHRLVAECWIPIPNGYDINDLQVNHKDFNRSNNSVENLEWVTAKENSQYSYNAGRFKTLWTSETAPVKEHTKEHECNRLDAIHDYWWSNKKIQATNIITNEVFISDDYDEIVQFLRKSIDIKGSDATVKRSIRECASGKRKISYKHKFKYIYN